MTDRLKELKKEAEQLGLKIHHRANEETIQQKINEHLANMYREQAETAAEEQEAETPSEAHTEPEATSQVPKPKKGKIAAKTASQFASESFSRRRNQAASLVRVIVTCMDPGKRSWQGEIFSVGSSKLGSFKKYIPYGTAWHIPRIMVDALREKKCSVFHSVPDGQGGTKKESRQINAYAVQELEPLTKEELKDLATKQARAA